jgi:hypothetical protein
MAALRGKGWSLMEFRVLLLSAVLTPCASPWASTIVSYTPGAGVDPAYTDPAAALGEPARFTGVGVFPGAVTPFNPAWMPGEIVSIGPGGSLIVQFAQPVQNNPLNPFGIDFLIFGNAGYIDTSFPAGVVGGMFGVGGGMVEVSQNGSAWFTAPGLADTSFPTLGYLDLSDPYAASPGAILSDFTRPVNPAFSAAGRSFAQIVSGYDGSGGGTGIDIASTGLNWIQYVRISNPSTAGINVDIDAFSIVTPIPSPSGLALLALGGACAVRRRRRGC